MKRFKEFTPNIDKKAYIDKSSVIIGKVNIEKDASIWPNVVIRGDDNIINIKEGTNVQDGSILHVSYNHELNIGENVTIGHASILHGCEIKNNSLIGMGSIILDGAIVGENVIIGAGSLVPEGKIIPDAHLAFGSPVRIIRELTNKEILELKTHATDYINKSKIYKEQGE